MAKQAVFDAVEERRDHLVDLATELWENPELSLEEHDAAALLAATLEEEGFDVERGVAGMETAFVARYGEADPVIGVLGEYDALPDLSQKVKAEREPVEEGAPGHGCGHNLFGVGSLGAAIGAKEAIESGEISGTVVYYGTPAEEILLGKPVMIRAGVFEDADAIVSWHPGWFNGAAKGSCLAMDSIRFAFEGEASHAGAAPEAGRSALDAVQLMNMGVEFMREHVPDDARIHYAIENAGAAPNVVDPEASVWYYVRAPDRETVEEISDWIRDVADGAATMTQTTVEPRYQAGTYEILSNHTLSDVIEANMQTLGGFEITEEERELAEELKETLGDVSSEIDQLPEAYQETAREEGMLLEPVPAFDEDIIGTYSTDAGNISYVVPVGRCRAATWPVGTPAHSWQAVAASGSVGRKAAVFVAKALAGSIYDLMAAPTILETAQEEFEETTADTEYEHTVPEGADPYELMGD
ncbi:MAG: amidohydrolase [Halobacteriales archaeon]|nr:amidohydrolase [Halobacteriales archaeon]